MISDRLVHAVLPGRQAWSNLDSRGNWLGYAEALNGAAMQGAHSVNAVNEVETVDDDLFDGLPAVSLQYDDNGNLIWDDSAPNAGAPAAPPGQRYVYDPANRLTEVWRTNGTATTADDDLLASFKYDALGRRIATTAYVDPADGSVLSPPRITWHIYDGFSPIVEYDVTGIGSGPITRTQAREFVWGAAFPEPVVMIDHTDAGDKPASGTTGGGPEPLYYLTDALGSVVALADSNGQVVERYEYDAYGAPHISDVDAGGASIDASYRSHSRFGNPFSWTGQRWDPTTRLYHFYARSYAPHLGRWLQRDPLGYADGINLYEYGACDPISLVDPFGLKGFWSSLGRIVVGAASGALGGAASGALAGFFTPPVNPAGAAVGAVAGAAAGAAAGGVAQFIREINEARGKVPDADLWSTAKARFVDGVVAGVVPGATAAAEAAGVGVSITTTATIEGGATFTTTMIETRGNIRKSAAQTAITTITVGLGGGLADVSKAGPLEGFWFGLDVSLISNMYDDTIPTSPVPPATPPVGPPAPAGPAPNGTTGGPC